MRRNHVETRSDRAELAHDAGKRKISFPSVLAGTLVAFGAFAVLLAIAAAVANAVDADIDLTSNNWEEMGTAGGIAAGVVLLLSYFYGGYVAGRMSRRSGMWNGFMVFVLGVLIAVGVGGLVNALADTDEIARNLRNVGIPTTADEWEQVGTVAGIAALAGMLLGSLWGGAVGERYHGRYLTRALDPDVGAGVPETSAATGRSQVVDDGTSVLDRSDRDRDRSDRDRDRDRDVRDRNDRDVDDRDRDRDVADRDRDGDRTDRVDRTDTTLDEDREARERRERAEH
ncbi:MAG TPA: TIGR04086 family membrane protein [Acidimicrobiales bacterium]|nr:TIGR04086 family membrane protein [Acidimicrobiales bacterium]